jgi:hypothetical protein
LFDFSGANWNSFKNNLEKVNIRNILTSVDIDEINEFVANNMNNSCELSIPIRIPGIKVKLNLPTYLLFMISFYDFYTFSRIIGEELDQLRNKNWNHFATDLSNNPLVYKKFLNNGPD